jgi:hypothetical protein
MASMPKRIVSFDMTILSQTGEACAIEITLSTPGASWAIGNGLSLANNDGPFIPLTQLTIGENVIQIGMAECEAPPGLVFNLAVSQPIDQPTLSGSVTLPEGGDAVLSVNGARGILVEKGFSVDVGY